MWNRNVRKRTSRTNVSFRQSHVSCLCVRELRSLCRSFMFRSTHRSEPDHANPTQPCHYSGSSPVPAEPNFRSHLDNLVLILILIGMYRGINLYRGINDFKKGYQPRTCLVKEPEGGFGYRLPQYYDEVEELFLPAIECTWG